MEERTHGGIEAGMARRKGPLIQSGRSAHSGSLGLLRSGISHLAPSPTAPIPRTRHLPLPVIPVIDIMGGSGVQAVGGERERYAPIQSSLTSDCEPLSIARALAERVGHQQLYVADLDALNGREPDWETHRGLLADSFSLWLDVGLFDVGRADRVCRLAGRDKSVCGVIAALESLPSLGLVSDLIHAVGPQRLVFSLDLRCGEVLTKERPLRMPPLTLLEYVIAAGIQRVVVIDVAAVGRGEGPPVADLCRQIRLMAPQVELLAGGGVRGIDDLARLHACGCDAALVSSWLHLNTHIQATT